MEMSRPSPSILSGWNNTSNIFAIPQPDHYNVQAPTRGLLMARSLASPRV